MEVDQSSNFSQSQKSVKNHNEHDQIKLINQKNGVPISDLNDSDNINDESYPSLKNILLNSEIFQNKLFNQNSDAGLQHLNKKSRIVNVHQNSNETENRSNKSKFILNSFDADDLFSKNIRSKLHENFSFSNLFLVIFFCRFSFLYFCSFFHFIFINFMFSNKLF